MDSDTKQIAMMHTPAFDNISEVTALTAQLKQFNDNNKWDRGHTIATRDDDSKYKWKLKAPKDGESTSKMVLSDGKRKKYHWCEYHKLWTIHSPKECKKQPTGKTKGRKALYKKAIKYGEKKKAYMIAKAALATLAEDDSDSEHESNTSESEEDSNASSIDGGKEVTHLDRWGSRIGNIYYLVQPTSSYSYILYQLTYGTYSKET